MMDGYMAGKEQAIGDGGSTVKPKNPHVSFVSGRGRDLHYWRAPTLLLPFVDGVKPCSSSPQAYG
jgi:hypothetical protein